ncbi:MAG: hypothetical protein Q9198_002272 [Flavoplaca austrocitrina]
MEHLQYVIDTLSEFSLIFKRKKANCGKTGNRILPTQAKTQDTPTHSAPKPEEASNSREGKYKETDAVHQNLLDLSSREEDPADHPSPAFERLKHDLMTAIQPYNLNDKYFIYNLNEDPLQTRRKKASNYNKVSLLRCIPLKQLERTLSGSSLTPQIEQAYKDLQAGNYRICFMNCQIQYHKYSTGNYDNPKLYDQRPVPTIWESVHCWKLGLMRMMILPFKDSFRYFLRTGGTGNVL